MLLIFLYEEKHVITEFVYLRERWERFSPKNSFVTLKKSSSIEIHHVSSFIVDIESIDLGK